MDTDVLSDSVNGGSTRSSGKDSCNTELHSRAITAFTDRHQGLPWLGFVRHIEWLN